MTKYKTPLGYILEYRPSHPRAYSNGCVPQHRVVYEDHYNCCLLSWVDIHHINGIRDDNRIENLQPYSAGQHTSLENLGNTYYAGKDPWNKGMKMSDEWKKRLPDQSGKNNFFYGRHHTEQVKQLISRMRRGKPLSIDHRKKLSESHMGQIPWNKGKKMVKYSD